MAKVFQVAAEANAEVARALRIIESMPGHAWSADAAGQFTYVSPSTLVFLGEACGDLNSPDGDDEFGWRRVIHPDDYDRVAARWRHCLQTGDHYDTEHRLRRADGVYRWFRNSGRPLRDSRGRITEWCGTTIDIEEQKQAEAALRDRERELSQLVDMVPSHLWRLTPDGEPIFFNKRMVDFLGLDVTDTDRPGMSRLEVLIAAGLHPDDAIEFRNTLQRSLATGQSFALRYRLRRADGVYHWMSSRAEPMRDQDGRIVQWYGLCHDIDDQVHADEAVRQSERKLRQLVDAVPAAIWCTTPDGIPTYRNKRHTDVTGVTLDKLTAPDGSSAPLAVIAHPDDRAAAEQVRAHAFATGCTYVVRYRQLRRDGTYRWTESRAEPLRDDSGNILQWYGVSVDIDDMVTAQAALRDRERELSQLVDMVPSLLWRLTSDGKPAFFSKRMVDFFGLDITEFKSSTNGLGAAITAFVHPDDAAGVGEALSRSIASGERFSMRYRLRRADGVYRWMSGRAEPLRDENGRIVQWYGLAHDIDDQMHAEEVLRQKERSLRQLVETLPAMIYCAAPNGEPTYRSRQLREFLGFDVQDKQGPGESHLSGTLDAVIHADELAAVKERYAHSLSTGEPYALKHRLRRVDGEYRWVETRAAAMRDADGAIAQWNGICLDIEEQVRAEEKLRLAQETLARASQAASLAELSASIAHEVNQPLAAVVANSHACYRWLSAEPPNVERAKITAERITRDANSAADVVSRIRALFRQSVEPRNSVAFSDVVAEARNLMAEEAVRRRVRMDVNVENNLPMVAFDRVQIQQVLINLIRNGMDAMDATEGERTLRMCVHRIEGVVRTELSDRGPGVQFPDKIFEPFFTTKEHGMGMGLAICRSIVESHGGRLWVEKNEPHGATFIFTLPVETKTES
jgi:PAS domain S-box-containing protein